MNQKLTELQEKIQQLKGEEPPQSCRGVKSGYSIMVTMITDLVSCILIGLGLGFFFQKVFDTSPLLTAGFTLLGGIAGFYTMIRFAIRQDKHD